MIIFSDSSIKYIILHYTAMTNHLDSIKHMCSANNKVSTHFLVNKKGEIYNLVKKDNKSIHLCTFPNIPKNWKNENSKLGT